MSSLHSIMTNTLDRPPPASNDDAAPRRRARRPAKAPVVAIGVRSARFVTPELAGTITGLGEEAVRKRIQRGQWLENKHWRTAPDGRQYIDMEAIEAWVLETE